MSLLTAQLITSNFKVQPEKTVNPQHDSLKNVQRNILEETHPDLKKERDKIDFDFNSLEAFGEMIFSSTELDPENIFEFSVEDVYPFYLFDFSVPSEINTDAYALMFGDFQIELIRKTRAPLALATSGLSAAIVAALLGLPSPYNIASAIALGGPLFVSTYGLLTQKN